MNPSTKRGLVLNAASVSGISLAELLRHVDEAALPHIARVIDDHLRTRIVAMEACRDDVSEIAHGGQQ